MTQLYKLVRRGFWERLFSLTPLQPTKRVRDFDAELRARIRANEELYAERKAAAAAHLAAATRPRVVPITRHVEAPVAPAASPMPATDTDSAANVVYWHALNPTPAPEPPSFSSFDSCSSSSSSSSDYSSSDSGSSCDSSSSGDW